MFKKKKRQKELCLVFWSRVDVEILFTWCSSSGWFRSAAAFQQLAAAARLSVSPHPASSAVPLDELPRLLKRRHPRLTGSYTTYMNYITLHC